MEILDSIFSMNMLMITLRMAVPLVIASIGSVLCERSGIINLGIEGMMLIGAFGAVVGAHFTGIAWLGVVTGIIAGGLFGLIHAVLCIKFRTNQSVSGVGINIFASGLTIVLCRAIWESDGSSGSVAQGSNVTVPGLSQIPVIGQFFEKQSPFLYITAVIVFVSWYVLYKTNIGLRLRTIGDHPKAAATAGVNVTKYRYICVILCGMLCGLAGAYLSVDQSNLFVKEMVAGRGFMALAATIFGGWNPAGSLLASLLFAFAQGIRITVDLALPQRILQMVPYLLTLVVLIVFRRRAQGPQAAGDIKD